MEQIVKYPSLQSSFTTTATASAAGAYVTGAGRNLVDLEIPANIGIVDLSRTAVVVSFRSDNTPTSNANGILNQFLDLLKNGHGASTDNSSYHTPAVYVRHASFFNARKGKVDELREVQSLKGNLALFTRNEEDANSIKNRGADCGQKQRFVAETFNDMVKTGTEKSRQSGFQLRIPLKDVFDFCNNPAYDTAEAGVTKLHFEFHFDKVIAGIKTSENAIANGFTTANAHSATGGVFPQVLMSDMEVPATANQADNTTGGNVTITDPLITRATYPDLRACPFYVGQQVCHQVLVQDSANPNGNPGNLGNNFRVITAIGRPTTGNRDRVQLTLSAENQPVLPTGRRVVPAPAQGQKVSLDDPAQNYVQATNRPILIDGVELQALVDPSAEKVANFSYVEYKSERDTYAARTSLVRNYEIPPNCRSAYVFFSPEQRESREVNLASYRIAIDNEDIIGRRVNVFTPLDLDLKSGTLTNSGYRVRSLIEKTINTFASRSQGTDAGTFIHSVMFPVPLKANSQRLTLDLQASGGNLAGDHVIYFECLKQY